jgi:phosphopantetheinyl transferase
MVQAERVPVSLRALIQRINRKLRPQHQALHTHRGRQGRGYLGDYYVIDFNTNYIVAGHVNVEALGRELEVLQEWEYLIEER